MDHFKVQVTCAEQDLTALLNLCRHRGMGFELLASGVQHEPEKPKKKITTRTDKAPLSIGDHVAIEKANYAYTKDLTEHLKRGARGTVKDIYRAGPKGWRAEVDFGDVGVVGYAASCLKKVR